MKVPPNWTTGPRPPEPPREPPADPGRLPTRPHAGNLVPMRRASREEIERAVRAGKAVRGHAPPKEEEE